MKGIRRAQCIAAPNIATIKYWGKRGDERLILPTNDSVSLTLSTSVLRTTAIATATPGKIQGPDRVLLDNTEVTNHPRVHHVLTELRRLTQDRFIGELHCESSNNFPTAAGMASSASGFAAITLALGKALELELDDDLARIVRMGSGSACRSLYGGFVRWHAGVSPDGSDCRALQVAPASAWSDLHILALVTTPERKKIGSTEGMRLSVERSTLMTDRLRSVPNRIDTLLTAIETHDFPTFGSVTMEDSDELHRVCNSVGIDYLTDHSRDMMRWVEAYNQSVGEIALCYTYDAGPNTWLITTKNRIVDVLGKLMACYPPGEVHWGTQGLEERVEKGGVVDVEGLPMGQKGDVLVLFESPLGEGPVCTLLDE